MILGLFFQTSITDVVLCIIPQCFSFFQLTKTSCDWFLSYWNRNQKIGNCWLFGGSDCFTRYLTFFFIVFATHMGPRQQFDDYFPGTINFILSLNWSKVLSIYPYSSVFFVNEQFFHLVLFQHLRTCFGQQVCGFNHAFFTSISMKQEASEPGEKVSPVIYAIHNVSINEILHLHNLASSEVQVDGGWAVWVGIPGIQSIRISHFSSVHHKEKTLIIRTSLQCCWKPEMHHKNPLKVRGKQMTPWGRKVVKVLPLNRKFCHAPPPYHHGQNRMILAVSKSSYDLLATLLKISVKSNWWREILRIKNIFCDRVGGPGFKNCAKKIAGEATGSLFWLAAGFKTKRISLVLNTTILKIIKFLQSDWKQKKCYFHQVSQMKRAIEACVSLHFHNFVVKSESVCVFAKFVLWQQNNSLIVSIHRCHISMNGEVKRSTRVEDRFIPGNNCILADVVLVCIHSHQKQCINCKNRNTFLMLH